MRPRIFDWLTALRLFAALMTLICTPLPSSAQAPFAITSPPGGAVLFPGQQVTIQWTGGDPSWLVDVQLVEVPPGPFVVRATVAAGVPNDGTALWTFPTTLPFGVDPCGRTFVFYVQNVQRTSWIYGPSFLVECSATAQIDIKPGSYPNSINPRSNGVTPVAILSSATFNAANVSASTVRFGPNLASPAHSALEDVNGDGQVDLVLHFRTQDTGIGCGDTSASVSGLLVDGRAFSGTDSVSTSGCR